MLLTAFTHLFQCRALRLGVVLVSVCFSTLSHGFNTLPDISAPENSVLTERDAKKIGSSFYRRLHQQNALFTDPELTEYIQTLGDRIRSGVSGQNFTFFVVKSPTINAFATPGGYIGVNAGLVLATKTEDELAGVLAHEIAHVTQQHIARLYAKSGRSIWMQIGSLAASIALASNGETQGAIAAMYAGQAAKYQSLINHTRDHEKEADRVGLEYLVNAGYSGEGMVGFFRTLQSASLYEDKRFEILRTHPFSNNRVADTQAHLIKLNKKPSAPAQKPSNLSYQAFKARLLARFASPRDKLAHLSAQSRLNFEQQLTQLLLLKKQGHLDKAYPLALNVLKKHPANIDLQLVLAQIESEQNKTKAAHNRLNDLYTLYPEQLSVTYAWVNSLIKQKQYTLALRALQRFEQTNGALPYLLLPPQAECFKRTQQDALYRMTLGHYYFSVGQYNTAEKQFELALSEKTKPPLAEHQKNTINATLKLIHEERIKSM